jgi:starch phosphorylase
MNSSDATAATVAGHANPVVSHSLAPCYDHHLLLDTVADPAIATARDRFEVFARSVRDALAQRWVLNTETYKRQNPQMGYYLGMEFLIGRSVANNTTNLRWDSVATSLIREKELDWVALLEQEPDPGVGNGRRLAARFLDSMATLQLPAMGYGLRLRRLVVGHGGKTVNTLRLWGAAAPDCCPA